MESEIKRRIWESDFSVAVRKKEVAVCYHHL